MPTPCSKPERQAHDRPDRCRGRFPINQTTLRLASLRANQAIALSRLRRIPIMALRGKTPEKVEKRLKVLFYGPAGCGKTTTSIQFPRCYLIDTERGAENEQYVKLLQASGGAYYFT